MMMAAMAFNLLIILIPGLVIGIASPWIMAQYGPGFADGWPVLIACLVGAVVIACFSPLSNVLVASGRMWVSFGMQLVWSGCMVTGTYALLPHGAMGLALAYAGSYLVLSVFLGTYALLLIRQGALRDLGPAPGPSPAGSEALSSEVESK
jgi:O-antigen/teichoic acid export membrane protein